MLQKRTFPWLDFIRKIAVIAIPVALQNLLTTTGSMVDTIMIAPLGETTVGAVGLCAQFTSLMFSCYWGFVGGGMLFFSQYWGAKDDEGIDRSYGITISFMLLVALTFACLGVLAPEWVMAVYTDKANIQRIGVAVLVHGVVTDIHRIYRNKSFFHCPTDNTGVQPLHYHLGK